MKIQLNRFPEGRYKALTMSYDDGTVHDRKLVGIFNKYGIKSTFHLNSGLLGYPNYISREEVGELYKGHEVSAHTVMHPFLEQIPRERVIMEVMEDRQSLERLTGYPVRGMSYPYGTYNEDVVSILRTLGIQYARTTVDSKHYDLPEEPLLWHPTCHHRDMKTLGERFLAYQQPSWNSRLSVLYVWGHSHEFHKLNNWEQIEEFCAKLSGHPDIWYATNIEIIDYMQALRQLQFSVDGSIVRNPTATTLWISAGDQAVRIDPGQLRKLREG